VLCQLVASQKIEDARQPACFVTLLLNHSAVVSIDCDMGAALPVEHLTAWSL
jgi:hypothetical protein